MDNAITEWAHVINCPMSDGAGIKIEVEGDADTVAFEFRADPDSEWQYIGQTNDYDTVLEWLAQVAAAVRMTKRQHNRREHGTDN